MKKINIQPFDERIYTEIKSRWDSIAKPLDSLGRFEDIIARIGAVQGTTDPSVARRAVVMMCADNGVVCQGISQSGQDVTYVPEREKLAEFLTKEVREGDLVITMGAGDIYKTGEERVEMLKK